ncbi:MAG: hypothetical protein R2730_15090 [Chitinophagales bacterium]
MSKELLYKVERTARVWTHGTLGSATKRVWLVAHGYGQLAEYFIKHFEHLNPETNFVIAPEALSRAYINGLSGRVGASWMTKEIRLNEIDDYIAYLDVVVEDLLSDHKLSNFNIIALGFSQGAVTISRWVRLHEEDVKVMVLWGGQPGTELFTKEFFKKVPIIFAMGNKDAYISKELRLQLEEQSRNCEWTFKVLEYEGEHSLNKEVISIIEKEF